MKYTISTFLVLYMLLCSACQSKSSEPSTIANKNITSPILGTADTESKIIADKIMAANGGQAAWDATRYIQWNFFGARKHIWDKKTNDLIIEGIKDEFLIKMNLDNMQGSVLYNGIQHTELDSLKKYLGKGKQMWNNDSYWLLMPFKLRDEGVTLRYLGKTTIAGKEGYEKIEMTFAQVGDTPDNKYHITIDPETHRIIQWEFFPKATDEKSRFTTPWENYVQYGKIWLSDSRGEGYELTDIKVDTAELADAFK